MQKLAGPVEGGFSSRESKVAIHELAIMGAPLIENLESDFTIHIALGKKSRSFLKLADIPTIPIEISIPEIDVKKYRMDGWKYASINLQVESDKVNMKIMGRFGSEVDYVDIDSKFTRMITGDTAEDQIKITIDPREEKHQMISVLDIMNIRLKSGDPKYARFSDEYPKLDVEAVIAMLTRYLKDFLRSLQQPAPEQAPPANGGIN
ncbi:MAG: hypothetical protein PF689_02905 [Deltaproteobacteria bacterium]|jgi:hypothetical protein|nr:hypothetical protein [Deltaproteobacteria bacterium]